MMNYSSVSSGGSLSFFYCHMVTKDDIIFNLANIDVVCDQAKPMFSTKIQSFVLFLSYYRNFVEGFSNIAAPLTKFTQKTICFQFFDACKESFQKLPNLLTSSPIQTLPKEGVDVTNFYNSSSIGLGVILMQKCMLIPYDFWQLKPYKRNYTTHILILFSIVFA